MEQRTEARGGSDRGRERAENDERQLTAVNAGAAETAEREGLRRVWRCDSEEATGRARGLVERGKVEAKRENEGEGEAEAKAKGKPASKRLASAGAALGSRGRESILFCISAFLFRCLWRS